MIELAVPTPPKSPIFPSPARLKLEAMIEAGRQRAQTVLQRVYTELPEDHIINSTDMTFALTETHRPALLIGDDSPALYPLHRNAYGQALTKLGIPRTFADTLIGGEQAHRILLIQILNTLAWTGEGRYLARAVKGELRGLCSDKYRRLSSAPIVEAFAAALQNAGALPYDGICTDVSFSIRAILPKVHTVGADDEVAVGIELCSSDYGARSLQVNLFICRIACKNLAVIERSLRRVHLGSRLEDDISFSDATYQLDTATVASAVSDITSRSLQPERVEELVSVIGRAASVTVPVERLTDWLKKQPMTKTEKEATLSTFNSADLTRLPAGQSFWRMSNAISWIAGTSEDGDRQFDLERIAGRALTEAV